MKELIYLDYAAHTPVDQEVIKAFVEAENASNFGNPNSSHEVGRRAKKLIDEATQTIASILNVEPDELIFTSGASESNNLAIKGMVRAMRHIGNHIISTPLEHPTVSGALAALKDQGFEVELVRITEKGKIDLEHLSELLRKDTVLCSISAVDSEIGAVQPVDKVVDILKSFPNCKLHIDATQAIGKIPFNFHGMDTVAFSAHKFFGIAGSGVLWKKNNTVLEPLFNGGAGEAVYRSGTPAVSLAVSIAKALSISTSNILEKLEYVKELNTLMREEFKRYADVRINSPIDSIPHILNVSVQGVKGTEFQQLLDKDLVCVSVKSACSVPNTPSRAVLAVSKDKKNALSSWRISFSYKTTKEEVRMFLERFDAIYKELKHGTRT